MNVEGRKEKFLAVDPRVVVMVVVVRASFGGLYSIYKRMGMRPKVWLGWVLQAHH